MRYNTGKMFRKFTLVILISIGFYSVLAQKPTGTYNSLLWRVTKSGSNSHSYLYGTMHATQKRLFYFTDSLYHFIEKTEGFATELEMKDLFPVLIESDMNDTLKTKLIVDIVRPEWLSPIKSRLEKKFGQPINKITVDQLKNVETGTSGEFIRKGEMNTIMDIYLSEMARRMGKWVGGIEDFEDQLKVKSSEEYVMGLAYGSLAKPKDSKELIDKMVKIYLDEDLDKIDLSSELWRGSERMVLVTRNVKMARRIDSLINIRSHVFAIGAAHIPGDSGLVELLQKRGYIVTPVFSRKRISPDDRPLPPEPVVWEPVYDSSNFYNILMPGKPQLLKLDDRPGYEPNIYADLASLNFFMSVGIDISGAVKLKSEDILSKMKEGFAKKGRVKGEKDILLHGVTGKEYIISSKDAEMRLQILLPGKYVAINVLAAYKADSLFSNKANRFFQSVTFNSKQIENSVAPKASLITLNKPDAGFKIDFPGKYTRKKGFGTDADTMWDANIYSHIGGMGEVGCWMITMEAKSGYYSTSDTGYFELIKNNNEESLKAKTTSYRQFEFEGYPACEFTMDYKIEKEEGTLVARVVIKGNKRYYFYSVYVPGSGNENVANRFLNSFKFVDLPGAPWNWVNSAGTGISFWAPENFSKNTQSEDSTSDFTQSYDKIRSNTLLLMKESLPKYQWWNDDSSFFAYQQNRLIHANDSLLSTSYDTLGRYKTVEMIVGMPDNHLIKKVKILPYGDSLIIIFGFASRADFNSPDYKKFFDQVKYSVEKSSDSYRISKAKALLNDLNSSDSATFTEASFAINSASFTKKDLPLLQQALLHRYQDSAYFYYTAKDRLMAKVVELDEGSTIKFVKEQYGRLKGTKEEIRTDLLSLLIDLNTKESFDLFKQLALTDKPAKGDITDIGYSFTDSLELTRGLFPDLLPLSSDTSWANLFTVALPDLLDSGYLKIEALKPFYPNFYNLAENKYKKLLRDSASDWDMVRLCNVLSYFSTPDAYQILNKFSKSADLDIKMESMLALARNNQPTSASDWEILAAKNLYRIDLYNRLVKINKASLFPPKYKNQKSFAESELYSIASDDDEPTSFQFVGERSFKFKGKMQKFLLFKAKFQYDDEVSELLLVAGPYGKELLTQSPVATMASDEYDPKKINEQVKDLLKWYEKEE